MSQMLRRWFSFAVLPLLMLTSSIQPAHAGATEWMDIQIVNGLLLVESEVAGVKGFSVIDTGAQLEGINARFMEAEGLEFKKDRKLTVVGVHGKAKRSSYREIEASVFGFDVTFTRLVEVNIGSPQVQLLLGASFLENYIFQFDYTNSRMRLITKDALDLKAIRNVESKLDPNDGSLLVRVGLEEDSKAWLMMDTGSNGGVLISRSLASQLDWIETYPKVDGTSVGAVSGGDMEYFRVPLITVGPFELENALVSIPASGENPELFKTSASTGTRIASRRGSAGLLGYDILQHFVVTVDYDRGHVHFYPGEKITAE